ncbi:D-aminoacyl-tRNA deacylase [uncultured Clostridium sp.]|uniref:D-aminoacyl-tRNA deacylase n=1 Tax=uncultured Clostridium sp. TaxID=59620 RepID=UPI002635018E|nr:D-aminoacyl-tRNA deacylase [uncultured Clostridium sp.]
MRAVVQRVLESSVEVDSKIIGSINKGLNVLVALKEDDTIEDLKYIRDKVLNLRVFEDDKERMNLSLKDIGGEILIISQFTLYGDCRKGRRPNFMKSMEPKKAKELYEEFLEMMKEEGLKVQSGEFGADMKVNIQNDGPVTILLESSKEF